MTKRMLIDATHAEETRVVVLDGNRLEDFDVETSTKRQLKGNIYLAKVVRVEPSLQAAFVEYGGNRHGFLAFSEIHPDYYQIPVADRQRLLEMQAEEARLEEEEDDLELALTQATDVVAEPKPPAETGADRRWARDTDAAEQASAESWALPATPPLMAAESAPVIGTPGDAADEDAAENAVPERWALAYTPRLTEAARAAQPLVIDAGERITAPETALDDDSDETDSFDLDGDPIEVLPPPETIGGQDPDGNDDHRERRIPPRFLRHYKIQEVIRRRQIMLVQVVKEERGTKGAALTTYLSLAGRFGVLMPNSPRGGGISRKITSAADRRRLREVIAELDIPGGMGLIVRTAGANRPKPEIKRDCEYLLRLWDDIREHTLKSVAPALIYEEASLIKRAIRDVYSRDIDEILVDGEEGWRAAHDFMRMLMPAHAKKVQLWRDGGQPLFARQQVEAQLDAMLVPIVQLRSGGYLVINQAEALVAIDVNSGRSTRERNIEETALRTNLEAADEVARQLRLRDLAGLIVIDFIDMESKRHNAMVERRIKEALKNDRARIQVGHISHFGLLEMSRQRLRPSLAETSFIICPHCGGTGHVRSTESAAIHVLRGIEDEGAKRRSAEIIVHVSTPIALYILNHKRERLREIELRYTMRVMIAADDSQIAPQYRIDKVRVRSADEIPPVVTPDRMMPAPLPYEADVEEDDDVDASAAEEEDDDETEDEATGEVRATTNGSAEDEAERRRKRRRRRRRGGRREDQVNGHDAGEAEPGVAAAPEVAGDARTERAAEFAPEAGEAASAGPAPGQVTPAEMATGEIAPGETASGEEMVEPSDAALSEEEGRGRRRGRRGGRRRRRDNEGELSPFAAPGIEQPDLLPVYAGPTPADPFGQVFDIFDVMDRVEQQAEAQPRRQPPPPAIVNTPAPEPGSADLLAEAQTGAAPVRAEAESAAEMAESAAVMESAAPAAGAARDEITQEVASEPAPVLRVVEAGEAAVQPGSAEPAPAEVAGTAGGAAVTAEVPATAPAEIQPVVAGENPEPVLAAASPEPTAPEPAVAAESPEPPPAEPAVKPILIGAETEPPMEKKRGWWRR